MSQSLFRAATAMGRPNLGVEHSLILMSNTPSQAQQKAAVRGTRHTNNRRKKG